MMTNTTQDLIEFLPSELPGRRVLEYQTKKGIGQLTILHDKPESYLLSFCLFNEQEPCWRSEPILKYNIMGIWCMFVGSRPDLFR